MKYQEYKKTEGGFYLVLLAISLVTIITLLCFVLDTGKMYRDSLYLQKAADAATSVGIRALGNCTNNNQVCSKALEEKTINNIMNAVAHANLKLVGLDSQSNSLSYSFIQNDTNKLVEAEINPSGQKFFLAYSKKILGKEENLSFRSFANANLANVVLILDFSGSMCCPPNVSAQDCIELGKMQFGCTGLTINQTKADQLVEAVTSFLNHFNNSDNIEIILFNTAATSVNLTGLPGDKWGDRWQALMKQGLYSFSGDTNHSDALIEAFMITNNRQGHWDYVFFTDGAPTAGRFFVHSDAVNAVNKQCQYFDETKTPQVEVIQNMVQPLISEASGINNYSFGHIDNSIRNYSQLPDNFRSTCFIDLFHYKASWNYGNQVSVVAPSPLFLTGFDTGARPYDTKRDPIKGKNISFGDNPTSTEWLTAHYSSILPCSYGGDRTTGGGYYNGTNTGNAIFTNTEIIGYTDIKEYNDVQELNLPPETDRDNIPQENVYNHRQFPNTDRVWNKLHNCFVNPRNAGAGNENFSLVTPDLDRQISFGESIPTNTNDWVRQYYNAAIAYADMIRDHNGTIYVVGLGPESPWLSTGNDFYEDAQDDYSRHDIFLTRLALDPGYCGDMSFKGVGCTGCINGSCDIHDEIRACCNETPYHLDVGNGLRSWTDWGINLNQIGNNIDNSNTEDNNLFKYGEYLPTSDATQLRAIFERIASRILFRNTIDGNLQ